MLPPVSTFCDKTIIIPVAILPNPGSNNAPTLHCAPVIVPKGSWTIVWNLVTLNASRGKEDPAPEQATFPEKDAITHFPGQTQNPMIDWRVSPTQWAASIDAQTDKVVDTFCYDIAYNYGSRGRNGEPPYRASETCHHDPTIVVSKDPIEPPPSGGRS